MSNQYNNSIKKNTFFITLRINAHLMSYKSFMEQQSHNLVMYSLLNKIRHFYQERLSEAFDNKEITTIDETVSVINEDDNYYRLFLRSSFNNLGDKVSYAFQLRDILKTSNDLLEEKLTDDEIVIMLRSSKKGTVSNSKDKYIELIENALDAISRSSFQSSRQSYFSPKGL